MKDWVTKKLDEVCELITCGVAARPNYVDVGIPFLSAKNVKNGHIVWSGYNCVSEQTHRELTKHNKPLIGDILYTRVGSYGEAAVIEDDFEFSVFVSLTLIKVDKRVLNNYFLKHYLNSDFVKRLAKKSISGSGVGNLNVGTVREFPILLPPLPEQQRIVALLDEAFAAIAKAKANAEQNLKNAKELFESYLQGVFENKGEGWEENVLQEVCEIKPPKKEAKNKLNDNDFVSFLPMEDLGVCQNVIRPNKERKLKDVEGSYTYFAENDILLAKITPCFENGKLGVAKNLTNGIGFGSSEYIVFRCQKRILSEFLFYFLSRQSFREDGKKYMSGAVGHKRVSKDWIENHIFYFPSSLEEQQTIVRQLDALRAETQRLEAVYQQKLADLEELKKSILQKAFAGELTGVSN